MALTVHYLIYKAKTVDDDWAEERTAELHSKSYDAHHIDTIVESYDINAKDPPGKPK